MPKVSVNEIIESNVKRDSYGRVFVDKSVPHFDNESFLESNSEFVVVSQADELHDLLVLDGYTNVQNDVALLLNAKRLEFEDPKAVADIIRKRFAERNVTSPFEGMSDDDIFANIKSRHIQTLNELDRYAEHIASMLIPSTLVSEPKVDSLPEPESSQTE